MVGEKKDLAYELMCRKFGKEEMDKHLKPFLPHLKELSRQDTPYTIVNNIYNYLKEKNMLQDNIDIIKQLRLFAAIACHPKFWAGDDLPAEVIDFMARIDQDFNQPDGANLREVTQILIKKGCEKMCRDDGPNILKTFMPLIKESSMHYNRAIIKDYLTDAKTAEKLKENDMLN